MSSNDSVIAQVKDIHANYQLTTEEAAEMTDMNIHWFLLHSVNRRFRDKSGLSKICHKAPDLRSEYLVCFNLLTSPEAGE
jgi:hypothetical protein